MALCIMKNYGIQVHAKKLFYFPYKCFWCVTYLKKIMEMLIYVIQIKNGNSGLDNEGNHVEDANTERVINTQVYNTNLYYL